jgi:hypothetical protein
MASIGQLKPLTSMKGMALLRRSSIAISLERNTVERAIPRKITASKKGVMKTIRLKRLDFIGRPWNLKIIPKK